jgi:aminopeptidase N
MLGASVYAQTMPALEAGVAQTLARWRAANYSNVRYKLSISLEKGEPLMRGDLEIRVDLTDAGAQNDLILDWRTTQFANDKDKPYANVIQVNNTIDVLSSVFKEHLIIPKGALKAGENFIKIQFASPIKTSGAAITRYIDREDGAEYVYSLFVPSDASTAFPVFDQPDLKARFKLSLITPSLWKSISNTDEERVEDIFDESKKSDFKFSKQVKIEFAETKPISTYVFAFATGDFKIFQEANFSKEITRFAKSRRKFNEQEKGSAVNINLIDTGSQIYVRQSQAEKFKQHAAEVFRLNREGVKYLENYFDFKFPFPKYDLVLIPEFPFGGMEHAGATFIRESSIIFPSEPTANDYISRANVMFHEAAHQWFGDTVTMKWFDDLWLKEGFAEFMAYKTLEKVMPEYNAWKAFYERNKPLAYLTDSTKGTTPIYQEIPNLSAAKSAYGNIVYRKAPSFLRQAEFFLGEDKFQTAVRAFLKNHQYANAEWTDLVKEFEAATNLNLKGWANVWVKQRGLSKMNVVAQGVNPQIYTSETPAFVYSLRQENVPDFRQGECWPQALKFLVIDERNQKLIFNFIFGGANVGGATDGGRYQAIWLNNDNYLNFKQTMPVNLTDKQKPIFIFPNYQDYGYGIFLLDEKSREYALKNIRSEKDDFLRSMMWGALWDSVREGELNPKDYVELAIKNISVETDELTIQTILSRVSTAMNYYVSDAEKAELAPQIEELLFNKMKSAETVGKRVTFYRAFLNVATTDLARTVLKQLLKGEPSATSETNKKSSETPSTWLPPLKTKDKFDIVTRLAILGDPDAPRLLDELTKAETSDDAKRYAYAVGAAFPAKEAKEKYFNDFLNNKEISESWIESAFVPFNSARHSELTLPYLERALAELPNLKRNRKIFFVNGWLAAFIGGQKNEKALAIVNKFLDDNPNLDKDLRLKILENVDVIERAVKIRVKFGGK